MGSPFLFSGLLKCPRCGAATVGQRQHKQRRGGVIEWHFYQCRANHQYGKTACSGQCISESVARSAVEAFLAHLLGEELDLSGYLGDAAKELAGNPERMATLKAEVLEAERGMKRLADAVASGALDLEAAKETTLELREKKERAEKRLQAMSAGVELGAEVRTALAAVQGSLATVMADMERERLRALVQLVLRRFSVEGYGGPRNRKGRVTAYEFTPEFQEFWLAHSQRMVGLRGFEPVGTANPWPLHRYRRLGVFTGAFGRESRNRPGPSSSPGRARPPRRWCCTRRSWPWPSPPTPASCAWA